MKTAQENILISLDMVGRAVVSSLSGPIIVGWDEASLLVTGWAVDKLAKKPLDKIYVCLDGDSYRVTATIKRPDVADHLKNPKYKYAGFAVEIPMQAVAFGWHKVSVTVLGRDGNLRQGLCPVWIFRQDKQRGISQLVWFEMRQLLTRPSYFFQRLKAAVVHILRHGPRSFWDGYLKRMCLDSNRVKNNENEPLPQLKLEKVLVSVDMVGKTVVASGTESVFVSNEEGALTVTGWAVDRRANGPIKEIHACLDQRVHLAAYGMNRADVADHFKNPAYMPSGFRVEIPMEGVDVGWHMLSITAISRDGTKSQGLFPVMIFRQGKKRAWWQLVVFELQRLRTNPARFLQRVTAASRHIVRYGLRSFWDGYLDRMYRTSDNVQKYKQWIAVNESPKIYKAQRSIRFKKEPLISVIVPVYDTPQEMLVAMIRSVMGQTYRRWELCIAEGASHVGHVKKILKDFESADHRVKVVYLPENKGISGNSNEAMAIATGEFIALLDHDDLLSLDALFEMVKAINGHDDVDVLYSDEDHVSSDGKLRMTPYFKPDFSPDTLRTGNYISHLLVIRKTLGDELGWLRPAFDGAQDYDLVLRACEKARRIVHVPRVLYHWRAHGGSTALGLKVKAYAEDAGKRALEEHLKRMKLPGEIEDGADRYLYKVNFYLNAHPLVSIIIPNKDQADVLETCLCSILQKSTYKNVEIIIVENNSQQQKTFTLYKKMCRDPRVKLVPWDQPFNFSALNNFAALSAHGQVLLFLNNDTEVISADWIERMLQYAIRPDVGVVGAKLYYPDKTLQHAGVIVGLGGVAGHVLKYHVGGHEEFARLNRVQNYSAVTAACLMMRRDVFKEVGGFNEELAVAFNDVDLCLKVRAKGYLVAWTPYAELFHHESKSRGYDNTSDKRARFGQEIDTFKGRWAGFLAQGDPYYNPNLTLDTEDFSIKNV